MIKTERQLLDGVRFIDLFAGLGGFRLALESLGANCVYSSELDSRVKQVYIDNFGDMPAGDITEVEEGSIPDHDILCAGFPCQSFSISGTRRGFEDSRGVLFFEIARIVKAKRPKVLFLENVRNIVIHDAGRTFASIRSTLEDLGYVFFYKVLSAADYGVPQKRERVYMVCFRDDTRITQFGFPKPFKLTSCVEDYLMDDTQVEGLYVQRSDIKRKVNKDNIKSTKVIRLGIVGSGGQGERFYSVKGVAITLVAGGGGVFSNTGGYLINGRLRRLHSRECARLMGFPDSYKICADNSRARKQLGNSVVVDVIQLIAIEIGTTIQIAEMEL